MSALVWNETYSVGSAVLDSDHRILIDLINQLQDAMETGQSRDVVGTVLGVLVEYAQHHFRREEQMMAEFGVVALDEHRAEHVAFEQQVAALRDRWRSGHWEALGDEVVDFLKKWLTKHILVVDKSYRPWIEKAAQAAAGARGHGGH